MKYFFDNILFKIQKEKWFWKIGLGNILTRLKNAYAVQFARSTAMRTNYYSTSGDLHVFIDHIF